MKIETYQLKGRTIKDCYPKAGATTQILVIEFEDGSIAEIQQGSWPDTDIHIKGSLVWI